MYVDALGLVSDAQAFTATGVSTSSIDLGDVTPKREVGTGEDLGFGLIVDVAADFTTTDETYQINVVSDTVAALSSPTIVTEAIRTNTQLAAGEMHFFSIPPGFPKERFIGLQLVLGGTTPSVTVTAWLTTRSLFSILAKSYAKSYTIS